MPTGVSTGQNAVAVTGLTRANGAAHIDMATRVGDAFPAAGCMIQRRVGDAFPAAGCMMQ